MKLTKNNICVCCFIIFSLGGTLSFATLENLKTKIGDLKVKVHELSESLGRVQKKLGEVKSKLTALTQPGSSEQPGLLSATRESFASLLVPKLFKSGMYSVFAYKDAHAWSFKNTQALIEGRQNDGVLAWYNYPRIGFYSVELYLFREPLFFIELSAAMMHKIPENIRSCINSSVMDDNFYFNIVVHGMLKEWPYFGATDVIQSVNNICYHGLLSKYYDKNATDFQEQVPMGIFELDGVTAVDLAVDAVGNPRTVYVHPAKFDPITKKALIPFAFSTNVARFNITSGRKISTFWAVAKIHDSYSVTFFMLINDPNLRTQVLDLVKSLFPDLTSSLASLNAKASDLSLSPDDRNALKHFVATVCHLISE